MVVIAKTPLAYRQDGKYRFELKEPFRVNVPALAGRTGSRQWIDFSVNVPGAVGEGSLNTWLWLHADGTLEIEDGYAWDGCSPAWKLAGKWWGTPTPEDTRMACLMHDALYQFLDRGMWTRAEADSIFFELMKQQGFRLAPIYYGAVRIFGGIHHAIFR